MATIRFFIQSKISPAGIYVRLREGVSIDAKTRTKLVINPSNWSDTKGKPHSKDEKMKSLARDLEDLRSDLLSHFNKSIGKVPIDSQWLRDFISPPEKSNDIPTTLVDYFDYYISQNENVIGKTSKAKYKVIKHLLINFQNVTKRKYFIIDVNENFKASFYAFCIKEKYAQNTIARGWKFIKTICYDAESNRIEINPKLKSLKINTQKVDSVYLDINELKLIEKVKLNHEYLSNARDWLLISCETGQRVSDFLRFNENLIRIENKKPLIEFTQVKTNKIMTVPLSKKVMKILKKRKGRFPNKISDQRYNDYIKEVCELAGLTKLTNGSIINPKTKRKEKGNYPKWQLVSSHIGRRSFATNNYGKIPTSLLIGATGHATERQFLEYIGKSDTQKALQLAEYF